MGVSDDAGENVEIMIARKRALELRASRVMVWCILWAWMDGG